MDNNDNQIMLSEQFKIMPIGAILQKAGLISPAQIQVALLDQIQYDSLLLGEILALHGWINQKTVDFFALHWHELLRQKYKQPIGEYLKEAYLLTDEQIKIILKEQEKTLIRFGALAVIKGYLKKNTVDFFLSYLYPNQRKESAFITDYQKSIIKNNNVKQPDENKKIILPKPQKIVTLEDVKKELIEDDLEESLDLDNDDNNVLDKYLEGNDVIWIV
jgi:hypothetical protein